MQRNGSSKPTLWPTDDKSVLCQSNRHPLGDHNGLPAYSRHFFFARVSVMRALRTSCCLYGLGHGAFVALQPQPRLELEVKGGGDVVKAGGGKGDK